MGAQHPVGRPLNRNGHATTGRAAAARWDRVASTMPTPLAARGAGPARPADAVTPATW